MNQTAGVNTKQPIKYHTTITDRAYISQSINPILHQQTKVL